MPLNEVTGAQGEEEDTAAQRALGLQSHLVANGLEDRSQKSRKAGFALWLHDI